MNELKCSVSKFGGIEIEISEKSNNMWIITIDDLVFRKFNNEKIYLCGLLEIKSDKRFLNNIYEKYNGYLFTNKFLNSYDLVFRTKEDVEKFLDDIIYPILMMKQLKRIGEKTL